MAAEPQLSRTAPRRKVARHEIRQLLRQRILDGECRQGSKLVQQQLAKDFGVSMGLVREALLELQAWGLVETHDNRGIFVTKWNAERLLESYDVREVLEGLAARLCCGRMAEQQFNELVELAEQIHAHAVADKWDEMAQADRDFHHRIVNIAQSKMLVRLSDNYRFIGKMFWIGRASNPAETRQSHLAIIHAIRENRPQDAELLARAHVARGRKLVEELIASQTFDPHWIDG